MVTYIYCSSYTWQNRSPFPLFSCSLKRPGVSRRPCRLLSCLAISLVGSLKSWSHSSDYLGSAYKVSILSEVLGSFVRRKSWSPFLLRSCLVLASPFWFYCSPRCCSLLATTSMFFIDCQITQSSSVLVSRPCRGLSLSTDCRENIFSSFIHLLSYLSSQLFLSLSGYHPTDHQIADSHPFSTCPPSVECQWSRSWLAVTLEAQQGPVDDCSTPLSRCSHDNTRFRLRSCTNIPWNTSDHYQAHGTGFQSISLTMGLVSNPEPLACDGDEMITRGVRTRYDLMLWCP